MSDKKYDLVVYGASGFTGRLVAEYLQSRYGNGETLTWAMAGRSAEKLASVRDEMGLPSDTPLVVADTGNSESVKAMVQSTRLVLTTVGPYQLYGSELVAMCADLGCDYVDLCGEPLWMRQMIEAHEARAKQSGARIVFSCGFDSIPSDLGIYRLQSLVIEQFGQPCNLVNGRVRQINGRFSGGTAASLQASLAAIKSDPELYQLAINPYALVPNFTGVEQPNGDAVHYSEELGSWAAPFIMAGINTRNVHRSNALLGFKYGEDFAYDEMMLTGPGDKGEALANHVMNDRSMAGPEAPKPGEGPSKEERETGYYDMAYYGKTADGSRIVVSVKGDRDPGYGSTCKMISESAVCLLQDCPETTGGIWTTATAMNDKLIARLEKNAGLTFTHEQ